MQVHKETIDKVPNSQPNRGNIEIEIYGMEGIPDADLKAHESARNDDDDKPGAKRAKSDSPALSAAQPVVGQYNIQGVPNKFLWDKVYLCTLRYSFSFFHENLDIL